jgi:hypothetical protein
MAFFLWVVAPRGWVQKNERGFPRSWLRCLGGGRSGQSWFVLNGFPLFCFSPRPLRSLR